MRINYRLEIQYSIFPKKGKLYQKIDNYIFQSENSIQNRKDALNKFESYEHIFKLSNETTEHIKLSMLEIIDKEEIKDFTIPNINLFYSTENFDNRNEGVLFFGSLLESFQERMEELVEEREIYEKENILNFETEIITDIENNKYIVLKDSPIKQIDFEKIK